MLCQLWHSIFFYVKSVLVAYNILFPVDLMLLLVLFFKCLSSFYAFKFVIEAIDIHSFFSENNTSCNKNINEILLV